MVLSTAHPPTTSIALLAHPGPHYTGGTPSGQLGFGICACVLRVFYLSRFSHHTVLHEELSLESRSSGVFQVDPEADRLGVHWAPICPFPLT